MNKKIVFCGGGNMAEGIMRGLLKNEVVTPENVTVSELLPARCEYLNATYGVTATTDATAAMKEADVVIVAVLPRHVASVTGALKGAIKDDAIVLSIVAGVTVGTYEEQLGADKKIVRVMPNTLTISGNGYSATCLNKNINDDDKAVVTTILEALGQIIYLNEDMFATFTAFSCSGPMWLYKMAEALIDSGVYEGFSRKDARNMVIKNMLGVAMVLDETGAHPTERVEEMCSPGGVTIEGYKVLQEEGFTAAVMNSIDAAVNKAKGIK